MSTQEASKNTPKSIHTRSANKKKFEDAIANHLASPFADSVAANLWSNATPAQQPQYLLSPSPVKRDLFSQLIFNDNNSHHHLLLHQGITEENSYS